MIKKYLIRGMWVGVIISIPLCIMMSVVSYHLVSTPRTEPFFSFTFLAHDVISWPYIIVPLAVVGLAIGALYGWIKNRKNPTV